MSSKRILLLLFCTLCTGLLLGQKKCHIAISGTVVDEGTEEPLSYVNIYIEELADGTTTDELGQFSLADICPGEYHFIFSHIGCEPVEMHIDIEADTLLTIVLEHTATAITDVVISGASTATESQPSVSVGRQYIEDNAYQNLSALLEKESGVHLLKNGANISKPVVQGLYGNRLAILNNGILQSGQQWGNDHSPEIDPYAADKVTVLKGASAIEYGAGNLGSVVLVEPKPIGREPHLHGQVNYAYESNGRGHTLNTRLGKYSEALAWRLSGTLKQYGDRSAPDYLLHNTGAREANLALQMEKNWNEKLYIDIAASTYNTSLGILRGSQIGNLTDLELAFDRSVPFFTEESFSRSIDAPRQLVSHHMAKLKARYYMREDEVLEVVVAGQLNDREEYDIRRSGRTDIPSLSLLQYTFNTEMKYRRMYSNKWHLTAGTQQIFTDNTNNPETGILPLIPDYLSWRIGIFSTLSKQWDSSQLELGLRYDFEYQDVAAISNSVPREIIKYTNRFHNASALISYTRQIASAHEVSFSTGYASRNPAINELYSMGLHQGVSGIEEGDAELTTESALKTTVQYQWQPSSRFTFSALGYYQLFDNYIYLRPEDEVRLTIRGAFPVFTYEQTDAAISGVDLSTTVTVSKSIHGQLRYSYLVGQDLAADEPLIFMPPNSFYGTLAYRYPESLRLSSGFQLDDMELELNSRYVSSQQRFVLEQDFVAPPPAYHLLGVSISTNVLFGSYQLRVFVRADNVLDVAYRDYLNRLRYFADDLGRTVVAGANFKF